MRMRAAILTKHNAPLEIKEVELDPPRSGEVLIKLVASGVCHSDINAWSGDKSISPLPCIPGHEGAGIVQQVGADVHDLEVGDHVVLTYLPACGRCRWCHSGQPTLCDMTGKIGQGTLLDDTPRMHLTSGEAVHHFLFVSTFAEYTVCPAASVVKVPNYIDLSKVCLFGCGFTSGYGAVTNAIHIRPGESIAIVGCGGLGLAAVQGARASNAGKIIAIDKHEEKLAMARRFGATHTFINDGDTETLLEKINELTWGIGVDYAFEFVGFTQAPQTLDLAFRALRKNGTLGMVGVATSKMGYLPFAPEHLTHYRKQVMGVLFGDSQFRMHIPRYVDLYAEGKIDLDNMVTKEYRLEDINQCIENLLSENRVARQVIRYD